MQYMKLEVLCLLQKDWIVTSEEKAFEEPHDGDNECEIGVRELVRAREGRTFGRIGAGTLRRCACMQLWMVNLQSSQYYLLYVERCRICAVLYY